VSHDTVTKWKWFWHFQDQEIEEWLSSMARQGLHLKRVRQPLRWEFERGAPSEVVYRVDFLLDRKGAGYEQLAIDAGWEKVAQCTGWRYWRISAGRSGAKEIFTDPESKIARMKRMAIVLCVCILPTVISLVNVRKPLLLSLPFLGLVIPVLGVYAYVLLHLVLRIRTIRAQGA
jgi:hypothetical protein